MSTASSPLRVRNSRRALRAAGAFGICLVAVLVWGQTPRAADAEKPGAGAVPTARVLLGPTAVVPLAEQPPAKLIIDPPLPDLLAHGAAVIQYRTENLRILPVFGSAALAVSPRIGHIHVTLDDNPWVWGIWHGTNGGELIIADLPPGPHKVLIALENPVHETIAQGVVKFEVPQKPDPKAGEYHSPSDTPKQTRTAEQPAAKLIVDAPRPDALKRGLAYIEVRTENVQIAPVYGPAAAAVSPRIGHFHISVDGAPWHWADATGQPVVVNGLPAGPHKILIELVDANHKPLAQEVIKFEVPRCDAAPAAPAKRKASAATMEFNADGKLKRPPTGYRKWVQIGTPLALHEGEAQEFHSVYIDPESFAHFEKTGQFRDGTVVVKEAVGVGSTESSAGKGYFMGEFTGLQVSIKDGKRFKDEPGNWAYFDFGSSYPLKAEVSKKSVASCNKCHQDNAKSDWVFSQYYPVLRHAAPRTK